eukprot:3292982-Heterocapsa_arctica.AAC.1
MLFVPGIADWEWDEYAEIWGFGDVPRGFEDYTEQVQAHEDRCVRGIPTQIEPEDLDNFYARVAIITGSILGRGHTP